MGMVVPMNETRPVPRRRIGSSDLYVHPLALGAATFGWTLSAGESTDILDRFVAHGGNLIDTADSYASGVSEQIIGSWMRQRKNRAEVVVATKVGHASELPGLSSPNIHAAVDASLQRLQTDVIDLLYFHGPDADVPLFESLSAVEDLVAAGKVRALGASNFSPQLLLEARVASGGGLPRIEASALEFSLLEHEAEREQRVVREGQNISLMPYFVLAHGFLGKHRGVKAADSGEVRLGRALKRANRHGAHVLHQLDEVATDFGASISAMSLAWVLHQEGVAAAAVGVDSPAELDDLMTAPQIALSRIQLGLLSDG